MSEHGFGLHLEAPAPAAGARRADGFGDDVGFGRDDRPRSDGAGAFGADDFPAEGLGATARRAAVARGRKDVDLFERALFERKRELPAWAAPAALGVALAVAAAVTGLQSAERTAAGARAKQAEARVAALKTGAPGADASHAQAMQAEIARLRARLEQLSAEPDATTVSSVVEGLAAATIDGVWLTRIRFDRPTRQLQLEGGARDARLLPSYLQSLARQPAFAGLALATVEAGRPDSPSSAADPAAPAVTFRILSAAAAGTAGAAASGVAGSSAPAASTRSDR